MGREHYCLHKGCNHRNLKVSFKDWIALGHSCPFNTEWSERSPVCLLLNAKNEFVQIKFDSQLSINLLIIQHKTRNLLQHLLLI